MAEATRTLHPPTGMTNPELELALELLIDATSLVRVVDALRMVCYAKADHLAVNWQDARSARVWSNAGAWFSRPNASVQAL